MTAINRLLQTTLRANISETGNMTDQMFEFIDQNKYMVSDNRTPFITSNVFATFYIEKSDLNVATWHKDVFERLSECLVYVPYSILEKSKINKKRKAEPDEGFEDTMDIDIIKKRRLEEGSHMLDKLRKTLTLNRKERLDTLKAIKINSIVIEVSELEKKLLPEDGEALISRLSDEQRNCFDNIIKYIFPHDFNEPRYINSEIENQPLYKLYLIEGSAGCGKSAIIESLNYYCFSKHIKCTKLLYVTQTNVLCQSMRNKCRYNRSMNYSTFFRFLGILGLSFFNKKEVLLHMEGLHGDTFQHTCGTNFLRHTKSFDIFPPMENVDVNDENERPRLIIIFDEFYTINEGSLSLFLFIVRCIKMEYPKLSVYCILIGDKNQLLPFTKVENVKLEVYPPPEEKETDKKTDKEKEDKPEDTSEEKEDKPADTSEEKPEAQENTSEAQEDTQDTPPPDPEEIKTSDQITPIDDDVLCSLIAQNESLANAERYVLTKQHRISDTEYNEFVNRILHADNDVETGRAILDEIFEKWPEKINKNLTLLYPVEEILNLWEKVNVDDYRAIVLNENGIFKRAIDTIVFCFTNRHAHFYNMSLAFSYQKQIVENPRAEKSKFIIFSVIFDLEYAHILGNRYTIRGLINNDNYMVNMLPLIRYCPYKLLITSEPVARLSIVYLLDWMLNDDDQIISVVVFSPDNNLIFTVLPQKFEMNLFKDKSLFGFPLQIAFSSTFASSQGLTLENKIAVSCCNISKAELYVCLTRIKKSSDLVAVY